MPATVSELQTRLRASSTEHVRRLLQEYQWILVSKGTATATATTVNVRTWLEVDAHPNAPVCANSEAYAKPMLALNTIHVWMLPWSTAAVPSGLLQRIVGPPTPENNMAELLTRFAAAADEDDNDDDEDLEWLRRQHALRMTLLDAHNHSLAYPWSAASTTDIPRKAYLFFQTLSVFARTAADARERDEDDEKVASAAFPWQTAAHSFAGMLTTFLTDLPGAARLLLMLPTSMLRRFARSAVIGHRYHPETAGRRQRVAVLLRLVLSNDGAAPDRVADATYALAQAVLQSVHHDVEQYHNIMEQACLDVFSRSSSSSSSSSSILFDHTLDAATIDVLIESVYRPLLLNRDFLLGVITSFRTPTDAAESAAGGPLSSASGLSGAMRLLTILNESMRSGELSAAALFEQTIDGEDMAETLTHLSTTRPGLEGTDAAAYAAAIQAIDTKVTAMMRSHGCMATVRRMAGGRADQRRRAPGTRQ